MVLYCIVLRSWHRRAGCVSQDAYILHVSDRWLIYMCQTIFGVFAVYFSMSALVDFLQRSQEFTIVHGFAGGLLNLIPRLAQAAPVYFTCLFKVQAPAGLQDQYIFFVACLRCEHQLVCNIGKALDVPSYLQP